MTRSRLTGAAICFSALVILLGACGGDDGDDAGGDARGPGEVDVDGETVRYRSDDGDAVFELDDAGEVRVSSDEGETVLTHGDGTVLPERWPADLELPDAMDLTSASTMTVDGQVRVNVTGEVPGDAAAVHEDLKARLTASGLDIQGESLQDNDDGAAFGTISATSSTIQAAVTVTGGDGAVTVSIFLGLDEP